jgi:hypothetical protein
VGSEYVDESKTKERNALETRQGCCKWLHLSGRRPSNQDAGNNGWLIISSAMTNFNTQTSGVDQMITCFTSAGIKIRKLQATYYYVPSNTGIRGEFLTPAFQPQLLGSYPLFFFFFWSKSIMSVPIIHYTRRISSKFRMVVCAWLISKTFHVSRVATCIVYLRTKFHTPGADSLLSLIIIIIKPNVKDNFFWCHEFRAFLFNYI